MESQKIAPNRVVSLSYSLSLTNGQIADEATAEQPLVFIHGIGQTLPEFDARIEGLSVGEGREGLLKNGFRKVVVHFEF